MKYFFLSVFHWPKDDFLLTKFYGATKQRKICKTFYNKHFTVKQTEPKSLVLLRLESLVVVVQLVWIPWM